MSQLIVDFITSLDGYASSEGWPGWWGLGSPGYLAWLDRMPTEWHSGTATGVLQMDEHGRIYANRECPYCGAPLEPLPTQRVACPSCGRVIHVETGPEGLTYLLGDADRSVFDAAWADYEDARRAADPAVRRAAAERYLESVLASYRAVGIEQVEISSADDPCVACAALLGRAYATGHAPVLPVAACEHDVCRCDYVPVLG